MLISLKDIYSSKKLYNEYILYGCKPLIAGNFTTIEFEIPEKVLIKLAIYDNFGREIDIMVQAELEPGFYEYKLDCSKYSEGVYLLKLSNDKFCSTRKMFIVR